MDECLFQRNNRLLLSEWPGIALHRMVHGQGVNKRPGAVCENDCSAPVIEGMDHFTGGGVPVFGTEMIYHTDVESQIENSRLKGEMDYRSHDERC